MCRMIEYGVLYGRCWVILSEDKTKVQGGIMWQSPFDSGVTYTRMLKLGLAGLPKMFGALTAINLLHIQDHLDKCEHKICTEPHWWLEIVAVEPDQQNQGKGTQLMQPILRMADQGGIKCLTTTPNERNIRFLERSGFELVTESYPPHNAPKVYFMIRNPKTIVLK